jgi:hypothetical protein
MTLILLFFTRSGVYEKESAREKREAGGGSTSRRTRVILPTGDAHGVSFGHLNHLMAICVSHLHLRLIDDPIPITYSHTGIR